MLDKNIANIARHYGWNNQSLKCIEECAELIRALSRLRAAGQEADLIIRQNVIEELADVNIMMGQIIFLLDAEKEVHVLTQYKLARQLERMKNE